LSEEWISPAPTVRPRPLLSVHDIERAGLWYRRLLGARSGHGGAEYEQLLVDDVVVLQLHAIAAAHHHGGLADRDDRLGNGVLVWFEVDDFDDVLARVDRFEFLLHTPAHVNPNSGRREIWLVDEDGYVVVCSEP
jgi:hypothetical protein